MKTVVLYHDSCQDGWGACWAAWRALGTDGVSYIPVQYGQPVPVEAQTADRLFILDFSYPRDTLLALADACDEVLVLDHHRSAQAELAGLPFTRFDMDKSGAVLAWEYFHQDEPVPMLLRYVDDRDRWVWKLQNSREISAALSIESHDFGHWSDLVKLAEDWFWYGSERFVQFIRGGIAILAAQRQHVESLASKAFMTEIEGHQVPAVNSPLFQSEIGEELLRLYPGVPFAACYFIQSPGVEIWSLRSRASDPGGGFDVSAVARILGGGGHRCAAGFRREVTR